jgi:MFS family permease
MSTRVKRHLLYAGVAAAIALLTGYSSVLSVFRSHLQDYLGIGVERFGLLFSVGSITGIFSILIGGILVDRWGPRKMIRICLVGISAAMFIIALGGKHYICFVAALGINSAFHGGLFIAISMYLAKLFPHNKRAVISLNQASSSMGGMMFPMAAEGLLYLPSLSKAITFGHVLHVPFLFVGLLILSASFLYRPTRVAIIGVKPKIARRRWRWRDLLLAPQMMLLAGLMALHGASDSALTIWMPRFLDSESFHAVLIAPGIVMSGYALAYLTSRITLATIPEKIGRRIFLVLPGIAGGAVIAAAIMSRNSLLTAGGYVLAAFIWSAEYPVMVSMVLQKDKRQFGTTMAVAGIAASIIQFMSVNGIGIATNRIGENNMWKVMLAPAAGFMLVGLGGLIWLIMNKHAENRKRNDNQVSGSKLSYGVK